MRIPRTASLSTGVTLERTQKVYSEQLRGFRRFPRPQYVTSPMNDAPAASSSERGLADPQ